MVAAAPVANMYISLRRPPEEYSADEEEYEEETFYFKSEECNEDEIHKTMIISPNITVKLVVNNKPMISTVQKLVPRPANIIRATNAAGKVVLIQKTIFFCGPSKAANV